MRLDEFLDNDVPEVGDILEVEIGNEVVETVITAISDGDYICETDSDTGMSLLEAEYHGHSVKLGKPMQGDVKKFKVYVKNPKTGKVVKVNFGDPNMRIKKSNPARRRSFRARHNCASPGPRTKARYWSCRKW
jgi:hypothetical protein